MHGFIWKFSVLTHKAAVIPASDNIFILCLFLEKIGFNILCELSVAWQQEMLQSPGAKLYFL